MTPDATTLGLCIAAACALAVAAWWWPRARARQRSARREDVLKHLCKVAAGGRRPTLASVAGALNATETTAADLLEEMAARGLVAFSAGELELTPTGRQAGMHIIRAHRLWECYLADQTGLREGEWHARAERAEHRMTPAEADALAVLLGNPTHDPHGDPIPGADGHMEADTARPLATLEIGGSAVLSHIEDEPPSLYRRLTAQGLRPGMTVRMLEKDGGTIRFSADGEVHTLETILANQMEILPLLEPAAGAGHLAACAPGAKAVVLGLAGGCRGHERRRLLDLGFVAGSEVEVAMTSPSGEPTAYQVRGTLIALHREQARQVMVKPLLPSA